MIGAQKHLWLIKTIGKKTAVAEYGQKTFLVRLGLSSWVELTLSRAAPLSRSSTQCICHTVGLLLSQMQRSQFPVSRERNRNNSCIWQDISGSEWKCEKYDSIT